MHVVVSACLMGECCKWSGDSNRNQELIDRLTDRGISPILVCPEMSGGLSCPRPPAERVGERILTREGADVTEAFEEGADLSLVAMEAQGSCPWCTICILQPKSPSCGIGTIYDGTFSGVLTRGNGVFVDRLLRAGYSVMTPDEALDTYLL